MQAKGGFIKILIPCLGLAWGLSRAGYGVRKTRGRNGDLIFEKTMARGGKD